MRASSEQLHPKTGARFVFEQTRDGYDLAVHLADGTTHHATLTWSKDGSSNITPPLVPPWALEQAHKLARVLKRTHSPKLHRWRPTPNP